MLLSKQTQTITETEQTSVNNQLDFDYESFDAEHYKKYYKENKRDKDTNIQSVERNSFVGPKRIISASQSTRVKSIINSSISKKSLNTEQYYLKNALSSRMNIFDSVSSTEALEKNLKLSVRDFDNKQNKGTYFERNPFNYYNNAITNSYVTSAQTKKSNFSNNLLSFRTERRIDEFASSNIKKQNYYKKSTKILTKGSQNGKNIFTKLLI